MKRKEIARETLDIMEKGYYETQGKRIEIGALQEKSVKESFLLTPKQGRALLERYDTPCAEHGGPAPSPKTTVYVWNCSTVDAILKLSGALTQNISCRGKTANIQNNVPNRNQSADSQGNSLIAVLNFASAKNPGGGFINGAMAQEESIAASSCLYKTLLAHEEYYRNNRVCNTMMYTNYAIYSPDVVFFRDGAFRLLEEPVTASVLTLPAVNMGQVLLKGENVTLAKQAMRERMKLALAIFASQKCPHLILGAYGCGVFRNDPKEVAAWWRQLLEENFPDAFQTIIFAVLDKSASQSCIAPFHDIFSIQ